MLLSVFPLHQSFLENDHVLRQLIPNTLKAYMFAGGPSCGRPVLQEARLVTGSKGRPQKTPDPTGTIHPRTHRDLRNPSRFVDAG